MKKLILSALMLTATMAGYAQETTAQDEQKGTTEYVFAPHWFLQRPVVSTQQVSATLVSCFLQTYRLALVVSSLQ